MTRILCLRESFESPFLFFLSSPSKAEQRCRRSDELIPSFYLIDRVNRFKGGKKERRIHFEQLLSKREIFSSFPRIIYCKMSRKIKILHLIRDGSFGIDSFNGMRPFCCFPFFRPKKTFFSFSRRTHSSAVKSSRNEKFSTQNVKKYREKFEISDS